MQDDVVNRDGKAQKDFGKYLIDYSDELKNLCSRLRIDMENVYDTITDPSAQKGFQLIEELIEQIENELPGVIEFGEKQRQIGERIIEAENFQFHL